MSSFLARVQSFLRVAELAAQIVAEETRLAELVARRVAQEKQVARLAATITVREARVAEVAARAARELAGESRVAELAKHEMREARARRRAENTQVARLVAQGVAKERRVYEPVRRGGTKRTSRSRSTQKKYPSWMFGAP